MVPWRLGPRDNRIGALRKNPHVPLSAAAVLAAAKGQNDFAAGSPPAANTKILAAARQATTSNFVFAAGGQAAAMEVIKLKRPFASILRVKSYKHQCLKNIH